MVKAASLGIIKRAAIRLAPGPEMKRAMKSTLPFLGVFVASVFAYHVSPEVKEIVDEARDVLEEHPVLYKTLSSSFVLGFLPDFLAQRFGGNKLNLRRSLGMTVMGGTSLII